MYGSLACSASRGGVERKWNAGVDAQPLKARDGPWVRGGGGVPSRVRRAARPLAVMADGQSQGRPSRPDVSKPRPKAVGVRLIQGSREPRGTVPGGLAHLHQGESLSPEWGGSMSQAPCCVPGVPTRPLAEDMRAAAVEACRESRGWGLLAGADTCSEWSLGVGPLSVPARSLAEGSPASGDRASRSGGLLHTPISCWRLLSTPISHWRLLCELDRPPSHSACSAGWTPSPTTPRPGARCPQPSVSKGR